MWIFGSKKPLFLVGTWLNNTVVVTDVWTGNIVTAAQGVYINDVEELDMISACIAALTDSGYPIVRVVNHTPRIKANVKLIIWSMHGPAVHTDFKIDYDPELQTAALIYEPGDNKEVIHVWSNVDSQYRLDGFKAYTEHEIRQRGHHVLRSFLDDDANMRFVTYASPLTVCRGAVAAGAVMQYSIVMLAMQAILAVFDIFKIVDLGIEAPIVAIALAFYTSTFSTFNKLSQYAQDTAECWMAVRSRRGSKDA